MNFDRATAALLCMQFGLLIGVFAAAPDRDVEAELAGAKAMLLAHEAATETWIDALSACESSYESCVAGNLSAVVALDELRAREDGCHRLTTLDPPDLARLKRAAERPAP